MQFLINMYRRLLNYLHDRTTVTLHRFDGKPDCVVRMASLRVGDIFHLSNHGGPWRCEIEFAPEPGHPLYPEPVLSAMNLCGGYPTTTYRTAKQSKLITELHKQHGRCPFCGDTSATPQ